MTPEPTRCVFLGMVPEPVLGDVARAAELDRQGRAAVARHGHGDASLARGIGGVQRRVVDELRQAVAVPQLLARPRDRSP